MAAGVVLTIVASFAADGVKPGKSGKEQRQATGPVTAVDKDAKTFTVGGRKDVTVFKVTDKTQCIRELGASLTDLESGQMAAINGKVSEDKTSITAKTIIIVTGKTGDKRGSVAKTGARGVIRKDGTKLSMDAGEGKQIAIVTTGQTRVLKQSEAKFEDIKVGAQVRAVGYVDGDIIRARQVTLRMPRAAREKRKPQ